MMRRAVFIYSPELERYPYPPDFPFNVNRARKVREVASSRGLLAGKGKLAQSAGPAAREVLEKFHTRAYLDALENAFERPMGTELYRVGLGTPDCPIFVGMYEGAALACGATLAGAELILSNSADAAFNPAGGLHHAGPGRASGFCYINDVALACYVLAEQGKKVLYLDVDVHHGDGVQNAFYERRDVMTVSFHQNPRTLFPGTGFEDEIGAGQGKGYCVNVPFPPGTYDEVYMKAFTELGLPLIAGFGPDVIVLQSGADALAGDPLAQLNLTNNVYADIVGQLLKFGKPVLATGGGGYNVENTVRAWALAWSVLSGAEQESLRDKTPVVSRQQRGVVQPAIEVTIEAIKANVFALHGL